MGYNPLEWEKGEYYGMRRRKRRGWGTKEKDKDNKILTKVLVILTRIEKKIKQMEAKIMASKQELEAAIAELATGVTGISDSLTDFAADFKAAVDELKKQIAAGGTPEDLGPAVASLVDLSAKVSAIATSLDAIDEEAEQISGKQTPPADVPPAA